MSKYPHEWRTFGDVQIHGRWDHDGRCSFCKRDTTVAKYSTRHYICSACIDGRFDVVLPGVQRRERFEAKLKAIREGARVIKVKLSNGMLVLGIEARNVEHFRAGHPMFIDGREIGGFADVTQILIVYGETLRDVYDEINETFGGGKMPPFIDPPKPQPS